MQINMEKSSSLLGRKALRRRESTSGQASKQIKKWRFEEQMSFLQKHFQERE
jgi:hypothetical protein